MNGRGVGGAGETATAAWGSKGRPRHRVGLQSRVRARGGAPQRRGRPSRPPWTHGPLCPEHQSKSANRPQLAARSGRPPRVTPQGGGGARARDAPSQADSAHPTPVVSAHRCLLEVDGHGSLGASESPTANAPEGLASSAHCTDGQGESGALVQGCMRSAGTLSLAAVLGARWKDSRRATPRGLLAFCRPQS